MIFGDIGSGEILLLALVAVFVFGPDRLPKLAKDLGRALRQVRGMATSVRDDIRDEVGPEIADFDLSTLNPKTFVTKHLFGDEDVISLDKGPPPASTRPPRAGGPPPNGGALPSDRGAGAPGRPASSLSKSPGSRRLASGPSGRGGPGGGPPARPRSARTRSGETPYDSDAT